MSKLDELRKATGSNVAESMGKGVARTPATHGASAASGPDRWAGLERLPGAQSIPLARITRDPSQPRTEFDEAELSELAESIRARGVLQPIRVRWDEGRGMYVVIAGERRWRASGLAGREDIPCVVQDGETSEAELLLDQLAENIIRLDLQPIEQARAFKRLMDAHAWSARRLADELHIDHDKVNRALRLLTLPEEAQALVERGDVAPTIAFEATKAEDPEAQRAIVRRAADEGLNRGEVVAAVKEANARPARGRKGRGMSKGRKATALTLRTSAGYKVTVEHRRGVDDDGIAAALRDAIEQVEARIREGRGEAA